MKTPLSFLLSLSLLLAGPAFGTEVAGLAKPWQLGMTPPASPVMEQLYTAHDYLLVMCVVISAFVLAVLMYICLRFNRRANPTPSKNAHNTKLEIIWTVIPVLILIAIAIPSLRVHYFIEDDEDPEMTLKVVGYQWYWHYEYPDHGGFGFDSYMKKKDDLDPGEPRLLAVDNRVVVPVNTKVRVHLTAGDVIHAWALPAFGVKRDAVPGRLNSSWFKATKTGTYYGQCSELCGVGHGFMPIRVDVVEKEEFNAWVLAQQEAAGIDPESLIDEAATSEEGVDEDAQESEELVAEDSKEPEKEAKAEEEEIKEPSKSEVKEEKAQPVILRQQEPETDWEDDDEVWVEEGWGDEDY